MDILISNSCGRPIYQQIYDQVKNAILSGELREGDMLPSIRALAKDLRISVITTKRAYEELEQGGYIYTAAGKGCFVSQKSSGMVYEEHLKKLRSIYGRNSSSCRIQRYNRGAVDRNVQGNFRRKTDEKRYRH